MNDEIKNLINQLDIEPERKQAMLDLLEKEGVTEHLSQEMAKILKESEDELRSEAPELMGELEQVHQQAAAQIEQAYQEYQSELQAIDSEAEQMASQASKDLDDAMLEESRAALS